MIDIDFVRTENTKRLVLLQHYDYMYTLCNS